LEFEISNKPNTPHASEKHEKQMKKKEVNLAEIETWSQT
jgi:hypothetical protein